MDYHFFRRTKITVISALALFSSHSFAGGVSLYLPLQTSPEFELQVERLASVSKMPVLTKPYHISTVQRYAETVKDDYPILYSRISSYLKRYKKNTGVTSYSVELSASNSDDKTLPNQRGRTTGSNGQIQWTAHHRYSENLQFSLGNTVRHQGGMTPQQTFVAFGNESIQVDVGYREHWYAPSHESAMLVTTQAETPLTVTISNSEPLTSWNIRYDVFAGLLDEQEAIRYGDEYYPGEPGIAGMHLSIELLEGWTVGGNRAFQFGGGKRSVSLGDLWDAFIDPASADNCGSPGLPSCDADQEVGNQLASVTSKVDFSLWDMPISFLYEYGGEDTKDHGYALGNVAQSYSFFLPFLTEESSFYMEYQDFHDAWYVHHLYSEGFSNKGNKLGHWFGDEKAFDDASPATMWTFRYNLDFWDMNHVSVTYRTLDIDNSYNAKYDYQRSHEVQMRYSRVYGKGLVGAELYAGEDSYGEDFYRFAVFYRW